MLSKFEWSVKTILVNYYISSIFDSIPNSFEMATAFNLNYLGYLKGIKGYLDVPSSGVIFTGGLYPEHVSFQWKKGKLSNQVNFISGILFWNNEYFP